MSEVKSFVCDVCGGELKELTPGEYECRYCKAKMRFSEDYVAHTADFRIAFNHRLNYDFDKAEKAYRQILTDSPQSHEACFGLLISEYGVEFIKEEGRIIPVFHNVMRTPMFESKNYLTLTELAPVNMQEEYRRLTALCESVRADIVTKVEASENRYGIFLCQKINRQDGGGRTREYEFSLRLLRLLEKRYGDGKIFLSEVSLGGGVESDAEVFNALYGAQAMIVVSSCVENSDSTWVKSEWTRYMNMIEQGLKSKGSLIPISLSGVENAFSGRLKKLQCLSVSEPEYMNVLCELLDGILSAGDANDDKVFAEAEKCFYKRDFSGAIQLCTKIIDRTYNYHNAYWLRLLSSYGCFDSEQLVEKRVDISKTKDYQNAIKFAPLVIANERKSISNRVFKALVDDETQKRQAIVSQSRARMSETGEKTEDAAAKAASDFKPQEKKGGESDLGGAIRRAATETKKGITKFFNDAAEGIDNLFSGGKDSITNGTLDKCRNVVNGVYVVPDNVTRIGVGAFASCRKLTTVKLHANVTQVDFDAFIKCKNLLRIDVDDGNRVYRSVDGLLYYGKTVLRCPMGRSGVIYIAGDTIAIEENAFYKCSQVTDMNLPLSLVRIKEGAFKGCRKMNRKTMKKIKSLQPVHQ